MAKATKKAGRPPIKLNLEELEKLGKLQCTYAEVAAWFNCTSRTIERKMQEPEYRQAYDRGANQGKVALRRLQLRLAESNPSMAIFLGKNYLGQRDKIDQELSGEVGFKGLTVNFVKPNPGS